MGRGRQKAKHTKVARQLKYYSPETDYRQLEQELTGNARLEEDLERWSEYTDGDAVSESDTESPADGVSATNTDVHAANGSVEDSETDNTEHNHSDEA